MALAQLHHLPFWAQHGVAGRGCGDLAVPVRELDTPLCGGVPVCSICMNQRANIAWGKTLAKITLGQVRTWI